MLWNVFGHLLLNLIFRVSFEQVKDIRSLNAVLEIYQLFHEFVVFFEGLSLLVLLVNVEIRLVRFMLVSSWKRARMAAELRKSEQQQKTARSGPTLQCEECVSVYASRTLWRLIDWGSELLQKLGRRSIASERSRATFPTRRFIESSRNRGRQTVRLEPPHIRNHLRSIIFVFVRNI